MPSNTESSALQKSGHVTSKLEQNCNQTMPLLSDHIISMSLSQVLLLMVLQWFCFTEWNMLLPASGSADLYLMSLVWPSENSTAPGMQEGKLRHKRPRENSTCAQSCCSQREFLPSAPCNFHLPMLGYSKLIFHAPGIHVTSHLGGFPGG